MEQLLEIHSVPIIIKCSVNREPIEKSDLTADVELTKNDSGFALRCKAINVNMDSIMDTAAKNSKDSYSSAGKYNQQDNQQLNASASAMFTRDGEISVDYKKILNQTASHKVAEPKAEFDLDKLSIQYEMDKTNFDMKVSKSAIEFTPADIQFTIEQRPEVIIKYIGGPIYVPPSADPDYEPEVDIKA